MLDSLAAIAGHLKRSDYGQVDYEPDQAINDLEYSQNPDAKNLTVIFPPWHMPKFVKQHLIDAIASRGQSTLYCDINPAILQPDVEKVTQSFVSISDLVSNKVKELKTDYESVNLLGISLGNVALCLTAEKLNTFDAVTMVVPGCDLADSLWYGQRTLQLRKALIAQGVSLHKLEDAWSNLAPGNHLSQFEGHRVNVILAKRDRFIPYKYGRKLSDDLLKFNPSTTVEVTNLGHVATILGFRGV